MIYLKMQLKALKTDGELYFTGLEDTFSDELALDIDEDPEEVREVVEFLISNELLVAEDDTTYTLPYVSQCTGSETDSTRRSQKSRANKALQCNTDATPMQQQRNTEKEIEIETRDRERNKKGYTSFNDNPDDPINQFRRWDDEQ